MGKVKVNAQQLPIKAHFFFFMAAMGPILPFVPVYGKQLGVSSLVMGSVTAVLPILFLLAKPCFGFLVDRYRSYRHTIFILLLATTGGCFASMYFLPSLPGPVLPDTDFNNISCLLKPCNPMQINMTDSCKDEGRLSLCNWRCNNNNNNNNKFDTAIYFYGSREATFGNDTSCLVELMSSSGCQDFDDNCDVDCKLDQHESECVYGSVAFWGFVVLMAIGNIGFNVSNCISDAVCFDLLGEGGQMSYGRQRVWGSIGFGLTAFLAGYSMDWWSGNDTVKSYTPAFILVLVFISIDILCCSKLKLPNLSGTESILKDVLGLLRIKPIAIFICFATIAGIVDSFIIYFLFWYLEDLADATGYTNEMKLIEGLTVFAETVGGEVIFFSLSGKILKKIGYGYSFVFCFACYSLRLALISLAPNPRWIVVSEFFMQGPSYALSYTTIVAYASAVAPTGTSATVQGIVAGMDDGLGFALGSLIGGFFYKNFGGVFTLRIYSCLALITSFVYFILHVTYLKHAMPETDSRKKVEWKSPEDAVKTCDDANNDQ